MVKTLHYTHLNRFGLPFYSWSTEGFSYDQDKGLSEIIIASLLHNYRSGGRSLRPDYCDCGQTSVIGSAVDRSNGSSNYDHSQSTGCWQKISVWYHDRCGHHAQNFYNFGGKHRHDNIHQHRFDDWIYFPLTRLSNSFTWVNNCSLCSSVQF